ncbi:MAG: thiamine pyrophosphate-binding protein, partial [bacterium]|nr:thiamine pyrophosphate-binding protein [bacterium]
MAGEECDGPYPSAGFGRDGGSGRNELVRVVVADRFDLPVTCTFRRQSLFDHGHRCYIGDLGIGPNPTLLQRIKDAELVLLVAARPPERPSQSYTRFDIPEPATRLVHVYAG